MKKPKLKKRKNPAFERPLAPGVMMSMIHGVVFNSLIQRLDPWEQLVVLGAAQAKAEELVRQRAKIGPKPDPSGPQKTGENAARK